MIPNKPAYANPYLEARRQKALRVLGPRWVLATTLRCRGGAIIPTGKVVSPAPKGGRK